MICPAVVQSDCAMPILCRHFLQNTIPDLLPQAPRGDKKYRRIFLRRQSVFLRAKTVPAPRHAEGSFGKRQVFWLMGHSPGAPSRSGDQWPMRAGSPFTAAAPHRLRTCFLFQRPQGTYLCRLFCYRYLTMRETGNQPRIIDVTVR